MRHLLFIKTQHLVTPFYQGSLLLIPQTYCILKQSSPKDPAKPSRQSPNPIYPPIPCMLCHNTTLSQD